MPFRYSLFNMTGIGFVIIAGIISLAAQLFVQSTYSKYRNVRTSAGLTGADVARNILQQNGIFDVQVIRSNRGTLSDHYDPTRKVVALSPDVYDGTSIASVSIAAHEVGHAIQHATGYVFIAVRNKVLPLAIVGSNVGAFAFMLGLAGGALGFLMDVGIVAISVVALFQLITLPVEFDASARALKIIGSNGMLNQNELAGSKKMLTAAALTYVASLVSVLATLARYIAIRDSRRD